MAYKDKVNEAKTAAEGNVNRVGTQCPKEDREDEIWQVGVAQAEIRNRAPGPTVHQMVAYRWSWRDERASDWPATACYTRDT